MLEKNPKKRPSINQILRMPIIQKKIELITEDMILGAEIANFVKP